MNSSLYEVCLWYINSDGDMRWYDYTTREINHKEAIREALEITTPHIREKLIEATSLNRETGSRYSYQRPTSVEFMRGL